MPSVQRGQLYKRHGTWHARLYDAEGNRRDKGGFDTKTAAGDWLGDKLEEVAALRGGSSPVPARSTASDGRRAARPVPRQARPHRRPGDETEPHHAATESTLRIR